MNIKMRCFNGFHRGFGEVLIMKPDDCFVLQSPVSFRSDLRTMFKLDRLI